MIKNNNIFKIKKIGAKPSAMKSKCNNRYIKNYLTGHFDFVHIIGSQTL